MILVTGATGFLGSEVAMQLVAQGLNPICLKRKTSVVPGNLARFDQIKWINCDLTANDLDEILTAVTHVYHCAALVSFNTEDRDNLFAVNDRATRKLVELCVKMDIRLVHVSSVATLGDAISGKLITEDDYPPADHSTHDYGMSKLAGEQAVWNGFKNGLSGVIANPSVILGTGAGYSGSGAMFKLINEGLYFYTNGVSGFVDVRDVARALIQLMNAEISGERFIISAENISYKKLFTLIATGFGKNPPPFEAKPWMLAMAWRTAKWVSSFNGRKPSLTKDTAKSSLNRSFYSNEKIKKAIGIEFLSIAASVAEITSNLQRKVHDN